jgi:hypothetical protein
MKAELSSQMKQRNPNVALRPGEDTTALARTLSTAHRILVERRADLHVEQSSIAGSVRPVVLDSWRRSRRNGIGPGEPARTVDMTLSEFSAYRSMHPMALVRPVVHKLLVDDAADTGVLVAISDEKGRLLWVEGDSAAKDRALQMNFAEGTDWSEDNAGTNAPGTSLALDHYVQIFGAEHYSRAAHDWSCSAAPVHDPSTGMTIGSIDISGGPRVAEPEVLSLVRATVAAAESELRLRLTRPPTNLTATTDYLKVLGSGPPYLVRGRGHGQGPQRIQLSRRHAAILLLLSEHPEGLTGDHLMALLDERSLDATTVRAEISRVRKSLGANGIGSKPYRLLTKLTSDVHHVHRAIDRGDLFAALDLYRGPVLPTSVAPGVKEIRDSLIANVEAARVNVSKLSGPWTGYSFDTWTRGAMRRWPA